MEEYYVNVKTQEEYWELMSILGKMGYCWSYGKKPSELNYWNEFENRTYIYVAEEIIAYGTISENVNCISLEEYKKEIGIMFTKDDLEVGMLVEIRGEGFRGSKLYIVMNSKQGLCINDKFGEYMPLEKYQNDLKLYDDCDDDLDIVKVYDLKSSYYGINLIEPKDRKLLWERKEIPEYTMEELREKFVKHEFKIKE